MDYSSYWNIDMFLHFPYFLLGTFIFSLIAYFIGSLNGGQILSMIGKKDLGEVGTKNFGATNAGRAYGSIGFAIVFLFDMLKAVFAGLILNSILNGPSSKVFEYASIPLAMFFVVVGHSWPIYFGFKGGKGVATSFGSIIVINWLFAIIAIGTFGVIVYFTKKVSIGSIVGSSIGAILIIFFQGIFPTNLVFDWTHNWTIIPISAIGWILIIIRHKDNILEIVNKEKEKTKTVSTKDVVDEK